MYHTAPESILKNGTDHAAGWEVGRNEGRGKSAPEHLIYSRECDWTRGYKEGLLDRKYASMSLVSHPDGVERMTGSMSVILNRLEKRGICGDIEITTPAGKVHYCGI